MKRQKKGLKQQFASLIIAGRVRKHWSRQQLAEYAGVNRNFIIQVEKGFPPSGKRKLRRVLHHLHLTGLENQRGLKLINDFSCECPSSKVAKKRRIEIFCRKGKKVFYYPPASRRAA